MADDFLWYITQNNKEAFEKCETLAEFLEATNNTQYNNYVGGWLDYMYRSYKNHGYIHRPLYMPEVKTLDEIVYDVRYMASPVGGLYKHEADAMVENRVFVSGLSCGDIVPFGCVGAKYEWSPSWLKRGEKIKSSRGGKHYGTYCRIKPEAIAVWEKVIDKGDTIGCVELIKRQDGKILVVLNHTHTFKLYLAIVEPSPSMFDLMPEEDKELIRREEEAKIAAFGE